MMHRASLSEHLGVLGALADGTRLRLCALLAQHELSVAELTSVLDVGQSKVSTHLARLKEQGLVADRKAGTSSFYRLNDAGMSAPARAVWKALIATLDDATVSSDEQRATEVVAARDESSWAERMAGKLERHYSPGRTWESLAHAFAGLMRADEVLDVGSGDGTVAAMLVPRARRYVCFDHSEKLLEAAKRRKLGTHLVRGDMHALPFAANRFALVLSLNVLAYAAEPAQALEECCRVVKPGGDLLLVTLNKHDSMDIAAQYGHRQPGFSPRWLEKRLAARGMRVSRCEVSSRERTRPNFEVVTCFAQKV
jgi:DNA-binding transcriptional ArsR family regulator